ncbi:hypothetical protein OS42_06020 [Dickeya oryzae]
MSSQTITAKRWLSKEWLMEQKSLIALLILIAVVSSMSPNFFYPEQPVQHPAANLGKRHYGGGNDTGYPHFRYRFVGRVVAGADRGGCRVYRRA